MPGWLPQVSCCGLEELLQLFKKHHAATSKWLGPGWQELDEVKPLLDLPPGKRYSRQHMPEVGTPVHNDFIFVVSVLEGYYCMWMVCPCAHDCARKSQHTLSGVGGLAQR
jgi:hypothetical protein